MSSPDLCHLAATRLHHAFEVPGQRGLRWARMELFMFCAPFSLYISQSISMIIQNTFSKGV